MKMGEKGLLMRAGICFMVAAFVLGFGSISQAEPKSIKVSAVISMTGFMAGNGIQLHEAYEIITKKVNAQGGIYVKKFGKKLPVEYR
jgi:branched-chain amino acid transport system substrate-binding protein